MTEMQAWVFYPLISRLPISPLHLHVWHALHLLHVLLGCLFGCIVIFSNYLVPSFLGGGPKQHLAVVVLKFFDHHDYEFHPKRKNIRGRFASVFVWPFKNNNRYSHEAATSHPTMHSTSS